MKKTLPEFDKILSLVRQFCRNGVDCENLAGDIVYAAVKGSFDPSYIFIRSRCYDELRRLHRENEVKTDYLAEVEREKFERRDKADSDRGAGLKKLIEDANLTSEEKKAVFLRFYAGAELKIVQDFTGNSIYSALDKLRSTAQRAKGIYESGEFTDS